MKYVVEVKPKWAYRDQQERWDKSSLQLLLDVEAENEGEAQGKVKALFNAMFLGEYGPIDVEILNVSPLEPPRSITIPKHVLEDVLCPPQGAPVEDLKVSVQKTPIENTITTTAPVEEEPKPKRRKKDEPIREEPS